MEHDITIEPLSTEIVDFDTFSKSDFRVVKIKNCEAIPKSNKLLKFTPSLEIINEFILSLNND